MDEMGMSGDEIIDTFILLNGVIIWAHQNMATHQHGI
jgi:hypothetical protein